jgi:uridine kinase
VLAEAELRKRIDIKLFVDTPADIRFVRRLTRDIQTRGRSLDSVVQQYLTTVRPMHEEFVEPSKRYADLIIPEGGENQVALDAIIARVERLVSV